jgi:hypothetical protein
MNLYQKLLKITEEIGTVEKSGRNQQQGYAFIEQAQVVAAVRVALAKYGVMILPEATIRTLDKFQNQKGTTFVWARVSSRYTIVNADDPEERMVLEWDGGEAMDTSDKATNKAITASQKYFLMKLFNISDREDPDLQSHEQLYDPTKHPVEPARQVNDDVPISAKSADKLRRAFTFRGLKGEQVTEFIQFTISKDKPETEADAQALMAALV